MKTAKMEWRLDGAQYTSGEILYLGPWKVGGSHFDGTRSRNDPLKYSATCRLPGIKGSLGYFETDAEAKAITEKAVLHWLSKVPVEDEPC